MPKRFLIESNEENDIVDYIGNAYLMEEKLIYSYDGFWGEDESREIYLKDIVSIGFQKKYNIPLLILSLATIAGSILAIQFFSLIVVSLPFLAGLGIMLYGILTMKRGYYIRTANPLSAIKLQPNDRSQSFVESVIEQREKIEQK